MLTSISQAVSWPETAETLCQVLDIHNGPQLQCHGATKKAQSCTRGISKPNKASVEQLLDKIVAQGSLDEARALLERVAQLVMCQKDHQKQGPVLLAQWEKALAAAQSRRDEKKKSKQRSTKKEGSRVVKEEAEKSTATLTPSRPKIRVVKVEAVVKPTPTPGASISLAPAAREVAPTRESQSSTSRITRSSSQLVSSPSRTPINPEAPPVHTFEPFGRPKNTIERNLFIKSKIRNPLLSSEKPKVGDAPGWVYMYTFDGADYSGSPLVKIGRSNNVARRMADWKRTCGYTPLVLAEVSMPLHVKVEKLVHALLWGHCMRDTGCPKCHVRHREWFNVDVAEATRVVEMWAQWGRQEPYDEFGQLKTCWARRLEHIDLKDPRCWESFVKEKSTHAKE